MIFSAPSKTYLCGEYAVLIGGPALILAHEPRFQLEVLEGGGDEESFFPCSLHPQSPAGRLAEFHRERLKGFRFHWRDPHQGRGGFGASGAQFLLLWAFVQTLLKKNFEIAALFEDFKKWDLSHSSGGDVLCQFLGGVSEVNVTEPRKSQKRSWPFAGLTFFLISTGEKLSTHDHLKGLDKDGLAPLWGASEKVVEAFQGSQEPEFLQSLAGFQKSLREKGLVATHSLNLLERVAKMPGFKGGKSCGALGADTLLVFVSSSQSAPALDWLRQNGFQAFQGDTSEGLKVKSNFYD